ncbi:hypothetical protein Z949_1049 [Sulfitobacter guttiformis KCTC 32187]|nr:hypothetical protein Z949_1049 [Sulfitobacter guttiformis KCTC 32187]
MPRNRGGQARDKNGARAGKDEGKWAVISNNYQADVALGGRKHLRVWS